MNINLIALDLDRTTLDASSRLSPGNRAALEYAISKGVHVVIASGRSFATLPQDVLSVEGIEYAITSNGASLWHVPSKTCLKSYTLPEESVQKVLELTKDEHHCTYEGFIRGVAYGDIEYIRDPERFGAVPKGLEYVKATRILQEDIRGFLLEHSHELESMDVVVPGKDTKDRILSLLAENIPELYLTSSAPQLVELAHPDAGKHSAVKYLTQWLGVSLKDTAAFGDGDNDADLLRCAGVGIAVANASPDCTAAAQYITLHHDKDGVAYAIHNILNI